VAQNAAVAAPTTSAQTTASTTTATTASTTTTATTTTGATTTTTGSLATWLQQFIQNTLANNPAGAFGLGLTNANLNALRQAFQAYFGVGLGNFGWSYGQQLTFGAGTTAGAGGAWYPTPQFAGLAPFGGSPVSAGVGQASTLGRLSVPAGWPGATPSAAEEQAVLANAVRGVPPTSNALLNGMPMGSAVNGRRGGQFVVRYGFRHSVMPRPPSAG
jgi:PPE-SVP subfamily C-terminal region